MKAEQIMARDDFKQCQSFHGHVCGGLAIGYLAATTGLAWLKRRRALDEELVAVVETDACCVDAIQVITGCTLGKGNLLLKDYGKMAFTFFNRQTGEGVRLSLRPDVLRPSERQRVLFGKQREGTLSAAEQAELDDLGHQRTIDVLNTPASDLFTLAPATAAIPQKARIEPSAPCSHCGEPTMATKLVTVEGRPFCRGCLASSAANSPSRQVPSRESSPT